VLEPITLTPVAATGKRFSISGIAGARNHLPANYRSVAFSFEIQA
jgi:hypothetical protein